MTVSQPVAPHPPGQVAHEGARRVANRGGAHRALQHGGEEGAEELVRDGPQLLFALLRFLCRPGRWSTRLKLQRPPEGSAQVDGNVAKIDLAARGVDGLVHFNAPSWAVRAVMSSTTLPVCPKTGSTSPSLTVHLCLHTAPGNRECAPVTARHATGTHPYGADPRHTVRPALRGNPLDWVTASPSPTTGITVLQAQTDPALLVLDTFPGRRGS